MALKGATFCISGTLSKGRKEVEADITKAGGGVAASVTGKVTHLLSTPSEFHCGTSKVGAAKAKGIHIVKEEFLWDAIKAKKLPPVAKYLFEGGDAAPAAAAAAPAAAPAAAREPPAAKSSPAKRKAPMPTEKEQHEFCDMAKNRDAEGIKAMVLDNPEIVDAQPCGRWSALHQFAEAGMDEVVKFLLEHNANRSVKTKEGKTPLDVATGPCLKSLSDPPPATRAPAVTAAPSRAPAATAAAAPAVAKQVAGSPAKKAKTTAGRPVDGAVPGREKFSVVDDWSVLLNQTNVGANNNKFYRIQVLQAGADYFLWSHWGRVGASGQNQMQPYNGSRDSAETEFKKKFRSKTSVPFESASTHDWTPTMGKYTLVETDDKEGDGAGDSAPLGKLSVAQIEKGQAVLNKLEAALRDSSNITKMQELSGQYYTLIPHDFGFASMSSFTLDNKDKIEAEAELLKFFMRMGFEEMDEADAGMTPVSGIMAMDLPKTLEAACSKVCGLKDIKSSNDKGKQHASKQSGGPTKPMDESLYGAIMLYTSNAIYRDLNNVLRSEDRNKIKKYFLYLRVLLEALGRLPQQNKTVWRGVGVDLFDQYKKGSEIVWWGCSSCTADVNVAKNFMKGCGGKCTLLTIESKTAADISAITFFGNEKENLLAPGTKLKVKSAERNGNVTNITMTEVGRVLD